MQSQSLIKLGKIRVKLCGLIDERVDDRKFGDVVFLDGNKVSVPSLQLSELEVPNIASLIRSKIENNDNFVTGLVWLLNEVIRFAQGWNATDYQTIITIAEKYADEYSDE